MEKLNQREFNIRDWHVVPVEGVLMRDGELVHLEPKVMEVLVYFASRAGDVISREELERDVWHGAVVGYDSMTATVIKLRKALQDSAKQPHFIATIPKRGYQLIATTTYCDSENDNNVKRQSSNSPSVQKSHLNLARLVKIISLVALLGVIGFFITQLNTDNKTALPSVVVLPFKNLSKDAKHTNFVDGMTEDIVTDLSRLSNLMVMASNTSFGYKGRNVSSQEIRNELKVDFILKGNIRRSNDMIRINVQLIDTKTGFTRWAERYDKKITKVFSVQNELTSSIVKALAVKVTNKEKQRLSYSATMNIKAYDYFQEGQRMSRISTKETNEQARENYRKAIELDPTYGRAYGSTAYSLSFGYLRGWSDTPIETLERALTLAEQAVALNDSVPQTYWALGYVFLVRKEFSKAKRAVIQAINIAPNYADGYGLLALISNNLGESENAIEFITKGMRLNPYYTWDYPYNLGRANYMLGNYEAAITALEQAQERNENAIPIKMFLATSYVKAGRLDDAEWIAEQMQVINPYSSVSHIDKTIPIKNITLKKIFLDDLRKAGLPE